MTNLIFNIFQKNIIQRKKKSKKTKVYCLFFIIIQMTYVMKNKPLQKSLPKKKISQQWIVKINKSDSYSIKVYLQVPEGLTLLSTFRHAVVLINKAW